MLHECKHMLQDVRIAQINKVWYSGKEAEMITCNNNCNWSKPTQSQIYSYLMLTHCCNVYMSSNFTYAQTTFTCTSPHLRTYIY